MRRLYLLTLEIVPLEVGRVYDELPSHLTLMSRFLSELAPEKISTTLRPVFAKLSPITLVFGETTNLGPKKVRAHIVNSSEEQKLHSDLNALLESVHVEFQYPEFIGSSHKAHVTEREGVQFEPGSKHVASIACLIEVVDKKRVVRARFTLGQA
jgi:hypothetical protein